MTIVTLPQLTYEMTPNPPPPRLEQSFLFLGELAQNFTLLWGAATTTTRVLNHMSTSGIGQGRFVTPTP